jgi:hypothetical protein
MTDKLIMLASDPGDMGGIGQILLWAAVTAAAWIGSLIFSAVSTARMSRLARLISAGIGLALASLVLFFGLCGGRKGVMLSLMQEGHIWPVIFPVPFVAGVFAIIFAMKSDGLNS